jgi:cobalamin biosynthesis Mg chelatase CobN
VQANPRSTTNVTTPSRRHQTIRGVLYALAPIAALVALLGAAAPASAAPSCARQVIDDWYEDGRVDRTYPLHCYDDAIEALPPDVRDYSSAKEDIQRALQARMRNEPAPPATTDPSSGGGTGTNPTKPPKNQTTTDASTPKNENPPEASGEIDSDSASSVPIPLLVLAGLALLLIAGGSAGYFIRRYQGRNNPPPAV